MTKQHEIEQQYARKNIREHVKNDLDIQDIVFLRCIIEVNTLFDGEYYDSKNRRLSACNVTTTDIVTELYIAVLALDRMTPIQSVATQIGQHLGYSELLDGIKTAAEVIAVCESTGVLTIYKSTNENNETGTLAIWPNYIISPETKQYIQQTQYLPPMVCKPKDWVNNRNGGYIQGSGSAILGALNHHNDEQCLDVNNTIQGIPWELNTNMLELEEIPNKPEKLDTEEKLLQFEAFKQQSRNVYNMMLNAGNRFFFVWKNDKRGRMNSCGYHLNLQSTKYKKSILQFQHKELLT